MDIFVIFCYNSCDDMHYGYTEEFVMALETFEKAKERVQKIMTKPRPWSNKVPTYDGEKGNPFIHIVRIKMGDIEKEIVFDSCLNKID